MRPGFIILLCALPLLCSCNPSRHFDKDYLDESDVAVIVDNIKSFQYSSQTCQMAFNRERKEFRAFKDDMSDYFVVDFSSLPKSKGQKIPGCSVSWTTSDDLKTLNNVSFKVEDINSEGMVWLWDADDKLVVILQLL